MNEQTAVAGVINPRFTSTLLIISPNAQEMTILITSCLVRDLITILLTVSVPGCKWSTRSKQFCWLLLSLSLSHASVCLSLCSCIRHPVFPTTTRTFLCRAPVYACVCVCTRVSDSSVWVCTSILYCCQPKKLCLMTPAQGECSHTCLCPSINRTCKQPLCPASRPL